MGKIFKNITTNEVSDVFNISSDKIALQLIGSGIVTVKASLGNGEFKTVSCVKLDDGSIVNTLSTEGLYTVLTLPSIKKYVFEASAVSGSLTLIVSER